MRMRKAGRSLAYLLACSWLSVSAVATAQEPPPPPAAVQPAPQSEPDPPPPPVAQPSYAPQYAPPVYGAPPYGAPGYPPGYGPPLATQRPMPARQVPWVIDDWDPEAEAPPGFNKSVSFNSSLVTRGAALLGTGWVVSAFTGAVGSSSDRADRRSSWTPLFVPLAGPFIAGSTLKPTGGGAIGMLALDAGVQTVGALGILVGLLDQRAKLFRYDANAPAPATAPTGVGGGARTAFITSGAILGGVGSLALIAGGITWIVTAGNTALLSQDCPNHRCVRGTPGGDELVTARNTAKATDILVGGGLPAAGIGYSLMILGGGFGHSQVRFSPSVGAGMRGASLSGSF